MGKTAILHIGTEKTGTTTIQNFLSLNREEFFVQGYDMPVFNNDIAQFWLPLICYEANRVDDMVLAYGLANQSDRRDYVERTRHAFDAAVSGSTCHSFIFSSEFLSSRLTRDLDLHRLRELLQPHFEDITILVYLREPLAAALSSFSTLIKGGSSSLTFRPPASAMRSLCDHQDLISRWEKVFPGKVKPRLFQSGDFEGGTLLSDFCAAMDLDPEISSTWPTPSSKNESLSWFAMKVMAKLNNSFPRFLSDGSLNKQRGNILHFIKDLASDMPKYMPTEEMASDYANHFKDSNEWVRSRFFPNRSRLWDQMPQTRPSGRDDYFSTELSDTESALIKMVAAMWSSREYPIPNRYVDKLRDIAMQIEKKEALGLNEAVAILEVARHARPSGGMILQKLREFNKTLNEA
jgi:hypothetical protein